MNGQRLVGAGVHPGTQLRQQVHQPHPHALERGHLAGDLGEVLAQLNRYFPGHLHASGDDLARLRFTGALPADDVDKALRLDSTVMLVDDPVKRVDNMTMAWGLEGRVPFLDHELVELAATDRKSVV